MSVISDYAAKQTEYNRRQAAAIDSIVASNAGLAADIKALNDKITELQNSSGEVTPEDQALIDDMEAKGAAAADRAEATAKALAALDEQTPPTVPTPEPVPVDGGGGIDNSLPKPITNAVGPDAPQKNR